MLRDIDVNVSVVLHKEPTETMKEIMALMENQGPIPHSDAGGFAGFKEPARRAMREWLDNIRGLRWCHGELVHWRKEKRRLRKLALLNAKCRRVK